MRLNLDIYQIQKLIDEILSAFDNFYYIYTLLIINTN